MRVAAVLGVVGLATSTFAQGGSATWVSDVAIAGDGSSATVTWSLNMASDAEFTALSASIFDTLVTSGSEFGDITNWEVLNNLAELTGDLTTTDGDNLYGTNAGQLTVFGPFTSANPIDVLQFTVTAADGITFQEGDDLNYTTSTDSMLLWVGADKASAEAVDVINAVTEGVARIGVVPSPAGAALLGLGGLAFARRRR